MVLVVAGLVVGLRCVVQGGWGRSVAAGRHRYVVDRQLPILRRVVAARRVIVGMLVQVCHVSRWRTLC